MRKAAWDELDFHTTHVWGHPPADAHRRGDGGAHTLVAELCSQRRPGTLAGKDLTIRPIGNGFNFLDGRGVWWGERVE